MDWIESHAKGLGLLITVCSLLIAIGGGWLMLQDTATLAKENNKTINVNGNRITALEQQFKFIDDSLDDIKLQLRAISSKLDDK